MSNYDGIAPRERRKSLFIVEGNHEKNELMEFLLMIFPEIDIKAEDIIIYGTNIYMLYEDIVKEYHEDWDTQDIELPFVVSKKKGYEVLLRKDDFVNIVLIFDYERHDPNFDEVKICRMQQYFNNSTDVGQLYINYPMVESYQHFEQWPSNDFANTSIPVTLQPGVEYKKIIRDMYVTKCMAWYHKVNDVLSHKFHVIHKDERRHMVESLMHISSDDEINQIVNSMVDGCIEHGFQETAKYQLPAMLNDLYRLTEGLDYYTFTRKLFVQIIKHNIYKTNQIVSNSYMIQDEGLHEYYVNLELEQVLEQQNIKSRDLLTGVIAILNTSVFFVPDYNFQLIVEADFRSIQL